MGYIAPSRLIVLDDCEKKIKRRNAPLLIVNTRNSHPYYYSNLLSKALLARACMYLIPDIISYFHLIIDYK